MNNNSIDKNIKSTPGSKTVSLKIYRYIFSVLSLLIIFISTVLFFFFYSQNRLYAENSGNNDYDNNPPVETGTKKPFILPLNGEIILAFRKNYFYDEKEVSRKHTGIDIKGGFNQNVFSSGTGIVSYIGFSPTGGRTIVIRHNEKIRTTYLNLLNIFVSCGDYVHQGDIIGTIGGNDDPSSENSHLHFGVIYDGFYLDPEDLLKISYKNITGYISIEYLENDFYLK